MRLEDIEKFLGLADIEKFLGLAPGSDRTTIEEAVLAKLDDLFQQSRAPPQSAAPPAPDDPVFLPPEEPTPNVQVTIDGPVQAVKSILRGFGNQGGGAFQQMGQGLAAMGDAVGGTIEDFTDDAYRRDIVAEFKHVDGVTDLSIKIARNDGARTVLTYHHTPEVWDDDEGDEAELPPEPQDEDDGEAAGITDPPADPVDLPESDLH